MSMQRGLVLSVALHSGVVLAFAMGLTLRSKPIEQKIVEVPIEIVRFAPESNPPPGKKPVPKEDRKPDADKSTADKAPSARKREDIREAKRPTEKTEEVKPPPKPKAAEKPEPKPEPKVVEKPEPKPKPVEKAEVKPKPKKPDPPKREKRKVANVRPPTPDRKAETKPKPEPEPPKEKKKPAPAKKAEEKPKPKPKPVKKAEDKPKPKPKPVKKAEDKPKPKPKKKVETKKEKKEQRKRQVADARPKSKKAAPKRAPKPKSGTDFDTMLKSVDKMRKKPDANKNQTRAQAPRGSRDNVRSRPLTISEIDAVRRQIRPCWNFPAGAKNARELRVQIKLWMNRDGTVQKAQILEAGRMRSDSFFRAAALAASRAVKNPRCGPLKLPPQKFDRWKVMVIEFDPSEMGDNL